MCFCMILIVISKGARTFRGCFSGSCMTVVDKERINFSSVHREKQRQVRVLIKLNFIKLKGLSFTLRLCPSPLCENVFLWIDRDGKGHIFIFLMWQNTEMYLFCTPLPMIFLFYWSIKSKSPLTTSLCNYPPSRHFKVWVYTETHTQKMFLEGLPW